MKENKYVYKEAKTSFGQIDKRQHELVTHVEFNKYINEFLTQGNHQDDALVEMYGVASEHETRLETAEDTLVNHTKQLVNHEMRVTKAEGTLVNHDNRITHNTNMNNAQDEVINNLNERLKVVEDNNADFKVVTVFANNVQKVETFVAQAGQRNFRLNLASYIPGQNRLAVYVNGVQQTINDGFVEVDSRTFQFTEGLAEGMKVTAHYFTEETSDDLTDIMETIKEGPAILEGLITNGESSINGFIQSGESRVHEFIQSGETTINGFLSEGEREVEELVTKGETAFDTLVQRAEQVKADSILVQSTKPKPSDNCDIWFDTSEDDFLTLQDYEEARNQAFNKQMENFESRFSEIKGEKGDKGEPGVGVLESDFKDYMGGVHETLREVHKANVDYTIRTAVGEFNHLDYEGQHITANHSIEGHVKSAILKGMTLVNLTDQSKSSPRYVSSSSITNGYQYKQSSDVTISHQATRIEWETPNELQLKPNTKYILKLKVKTGTQERRFEFKNSDSTISCDALVLSANTLHDLTCEILTTQDYKPNITYLYLRPSDWENSANDVFEVYDLMLIEYQEELKNLDIPFFTGMQSVRMPVLKATGKNLYPYGDLTMNNPITNRWYYTNGITSSFGPSCKRTDGGNWFYLEKGVYNYQSTRKNTKTNIVLVGEGETQHHSGKDIPSGWYVFRFKTMDEPVDYAKISQIQLEKGSTATPYEPHKSNILTTSEEVELRGVGEVQDELNLLTGELTQHIGEIVLDGSEAWYYGAGNSNETIALFYLKLDDNKNYKPSINDKLPSIGGYGMNFGEGIYVDGDINIRVDCKKLNETSINNFKQWLSNNPITLQYKLDQPSVKTVVLSDNVVYSYDEVTHYDCSSEDGSLIPTVAVKVPTDVQAVITDQSATIQTLEQENQALKKTQDTLLVVQLGMMEQMATTLAESEEQPAYLKALRQLASERGLL